MLRTFLQYTSPILANWTKCSGWFSLFAPISKIVTPLPSEVGNVVHKHALWIPSINFNLIVAPVKNAPVDPAETTPSQFFKATCSPHRFVSYLVILS